MDKPICAGNPTFRHGDGPTIPTKWPHDIPGYLCQTPPFGIFSAPRFAECCAGKVYNVTQPTTPDDEAYPLSCVALCVIGSGPTISGSGLGSKDGPSPLTDFYHCLSEDSNANSGDDGDDDKTWDLTCAMNSVDGAPSHSSSSSSSSHGPTTIGSITSSSSSPGPTTIGSITTSSSSPSHGPTTIGTILPPSSSGSSTTPSGTDTIPSPTASPTSPDNAAVGGHGRRLGKLQLWTGMLVLAALLT